MTNLCFSTFHSTDYEDNVNQTLQKSSSATNASATTNASENIAPTTHPSNVNNSSSKRKDGSKVDDSSKKEDSARSQEEKRRHIKSIIDKIPTGKSDLFNYKLDWNEIDNPLMEKKIRPWINKKIIEYIGEPEPTLVDFICSKVLAGSTPQGILDDVQMVSIRHSSWSYSFLLFINFIFTVDFATGIGRRSWSFCCKNVAITHLRGRSKKSWPRQMKLSQQTQRITWMSRHSKSAAEIQKEKSWKMRKSINKQNKT